MIVGSGLLASEFAKYYAERSDIIIFASGVSNSNEVNNEEFSREKNLLQRSMPKSATLVYFGTCSIYDPDMKTKPYTLHKMEMERLVANEFPSHIIFRLPQLVGKKGNKNTLTNYLYNRISTNKEFQVWRSAHRYLIDVCDVQKIVSAILISGSHEMEIINIAPPTSISVLNIVEIIEKILIKKANYSIVDGGEIYNIDAILANKYASIAGIDFDKNYPDRILRKYYGK